MDTVYTGLSTIGEVFAVLKAIIVTIISIGLIGFGIYILYVNWEYLEDHTGTVIADSICSKLEAAGYTDQQKDTKLQECKTNVTWTDSTGKKHTQVFTNFYTYKKGETVTVFYKEDDPEGTAKLDFFPKQLGYFLIGFGLFIALISWGWVYLVDRYKWLAAFSGGADVFNIGRKIL